MEGLIVKLKRFSKIIKQNEKCQEKNVLCLNNHPIAFMIISKQLIFQRSVW